MSVVCNNFILPYGECKACGMSQKGLFHEQNNICNQDSFGVFCADNILIFAVADGVGSCELSHIGSSAAVEILQDVFMNNNVAKMGIDEIKSKIVEKWGTRFQVERAKYSTTLKFVVVCENCIILGNIGDGKFIVNIDGERCNYFQDENGFSNYTYALTDKISEDKFTVKIKQWDKAVQLAIMTDGIGNEINNDLENNFLSYLMELLEQPPKAMEQEMSDWITQLQENNCDDKTIVVAKIIKNV